jgi:hypothetical protein
MPPFRFVAEAMKLRIEQDTRVDDGARLIVPGRRVALAQKRLS